MAKTWGMLAGYQCGREIRSKEGARKRREFALCTFDWVGVGGEERPAEGVTLEQRC